MTPAPGNSPSQNLRGDQGAQRALTLVVLAMLSLPAIDAIAKFLSATLPAAQITWARFVVQVALMAPFVMTAYRPVPFKNSAVHVLRGALIATTTVLVFAAVKFMPIADAIAIFFVEPLVVTVFSAIFLGERIGWRRIAAVIVGFAGALIVIRPSYELFGLTAVLPLAAAFTFAIYIVLTRRLVRDQDPVAMQFSAGLSGLVLMSVCLILGHAFHIPVFDPAWPTFAEWMLLGLSGVVATVGHHLIVVACRHLEASALAPFQYLEIVGATVLGLLLFDDFPDALTWVGIVVIVCSGLYVFHREQVRGATP